MGLNEQIDCLRAIVYNSTSRDAFFLAPQEAGAVYGLTAAESEMMARIGYQRLEFIWDNRLSGMYKKWRQDLFPLTVRLLEREAGGKKGVLERYKAFVRVHGEWNDFDGQAFYECVREMAGGGLLRATSLITDIAEQEYVGAFVSGVTPAHPVAGVELKEVGATEQGLVVFQARYAVEAVERALEDGHEVESLTEQPHTLLFLRDDEGQGTRLVLERSLSLEWQGVWEREAFFQAMQASFAPSSPAEPR